MPIFEKFLTKTESSANFTPSSEPDPGADPFWRLSPNPVKHVAQVVFQAPFTGTVVVTDQAGRAVWRNDLSAASALTLPVHDLSPGMYFVSATGEHSGARVLKMIVVR